MEAIETIQYRGQKIEIFPDEQPMEDPNDFHDERFIVYDHRQFYVKRDGFDPHDIWEYLKTKRRLYDGHHIFPLYAYIHGGVALSVGDHNFPDARWDVSMKGFVLIKRCKGSWTSDDALKHAERLVKLWNEYLSGEIYGYRCMDESCWGYYGDEGMKQAIEEAKSEIDAVLSCKNKERIQRLKKYIKSKVPIQYRKLEPVM